MIDMHVHTRRCRHATGDAAEYVREAAARGVRILAFTEHMPLAPELASRVPGAQGYAMPASELTEYVAEVASARELGAEVGVEVLLGLEADLVEAAVSHARDIVSSASFDVVLGSVHFVGDWAFDDPDREEGYAHWRPEDLWERYFDDLVAAARTGIADVIAHADLVKKFGFVPVGPLDDLYRTTAEALSMAGVAVEVNTAGLRKPCREIYPALGFLKELRRRNVPVTVGSDAHAPSEVAYGAAEARAALEAAGYASVVVFRGRVAEEVGLDEV